MKKTNLMEFMKKILTVLILFIFTSPAFATPAIEIPFQNEGNTTFELGIHFDWISKSQMQRDENIKEIQNLLFKEDTIVKYNKNEFKTKYAPFFKNKNYMNDYEDISNGKKEDTEKNYCGFYMGKLLVAYGIQYKNHMDNIYYYDALGNLRWVDVFSENYPNYPFWSYQYERNGKMVAAYYFISADDQYIYDSDKKFKGRWYKENMYNRKAKIIMKRTNW